VLMYECATGQNPFNADSFAEIFKLIGSASFAAPTALRPELSKRFERIVLRAMSLDPADRFADLRELGRELLLLAGQRTRVTWALSFGDVPRKTLANAVVTPRATVALARPRARKKLLLGLAAVLLFLVPIVIWLGVSEHAPPNVTSVASTIAPATPPTGAHPETERREASDGPEMRRDVVEPDEPHSRPPSRPEIKHTRSRVAPQTPADGPDRELQWALPINSTPPPAKAAVRTGANGAPIFD